MPSSSSRTRPLNDSTSGHCQWIKDGWAVGYRFEP